MAQLPFSMNGEMSSQASFLAELNRQRQERLRAQQQQIIQPVSPQRPPSSPPPPPPSNQASTIQLAQEAQIRERRERLRLEHEQRQRELEAQQRILEEQQREEESRHQIQLARQNEFISEINSLLVGLIAEINEAATFSRVNDILSEIHEVLHRQFDGVSFLEIEVIRQDANRLFEVINEIVTNISNNHHLIATPENNAARMQMSMLVDLINQGLGTNMEIPVEVVPNTSEDENMAQQFQQELERERLEQETQQLIQQYGISAQHFPPLLPPSPPVQPSLNLISLDNIQNLMRNGQIITFEQDPSLQRHTQRPNSVLTFYGNNGQTYYVNTLYNPNTNVLTPALSSTPPLLGLAEVQNLLRAGQIVGFEINPNLQYMVQPPNNLITLNGQNQIRYFVIGRYDPNSNQIFPAV